jgi:hypothetical protein
MPPLELSEDDGFPRPSKQSIAIDFLENRNEDFRNAQGEFPCRFDPSRQKFVARPVAFPSHDIPPDATEDELRKSKLEVVATTKSFSNALAALKSKKSKNETIASFDLDTCHDWEEVTARIQTVVDEYGKTDTIWGKLRGAFREVGGNARSIQAFVGLLPDGEYKTLCGGLTLILTVSNL